MMVLVVLLIRWTLPGVLLMLHQALDHGVEADNKPQPHIVLLVADDLGWHDMSWHNPKVHTPNLGELATTGVILNQSYVMHICTPSRSALMTGRYPFTIGRQHGVIRPMEPVGLTMNISTILPQELKRLGYSTHAVGKWHLGFCNWKYTPTKRGFDTFYGYYNGAEDYFTHRLPAFIEMFSDGDYCVGSGQDIVNETKSTNLGENSTKEFVKKQNLEGSSAVSWQEECAACGHGGYDFRNDTVPDFGVEETYSTYVFASYIEGLLRRRNASDPMFLYVPFQSVHRPLQVPPKYIEPFEYVHDHNRKTYMGMLSALDEAVGRIVQALKETQHYDNSIIVFTTDNGGQTMTGGNNWPLRGRKGTLWEGGTRGSAFVHSPLLNNTAGTVSNQLVHISDWYATLVGVAGGDVPKDLDSIDQWEALAGRAQPPRDIMVYNLDDSDGIKGAIRIGDYKLLLGDQGFDEWVLPPEGLSNQNVTEVHNVTESLQSTDDKIPTFNLTIDSNNNNLNIGNSFNLNTKKVKKSKKQVSSNKDFLGAYQGKESSFQETLSNKTPITNLSQTQWTGIPPVTFADMLSRRPEELIGYKELQIRLFNLKDDPAERTDLADSKPNMVIELLDQLLKELPRLIEPDIKPEDNRANPKYWQNIWSPGWC